MMRIIALPVIVAMMPVIIVANAFKWYGLQCLIIRWALALDYWMRDGIR